MTDLLEGLLADLKAEGDQLWAAVAGLDDAGWATPTPAAGWTVATQVAHLLWTDETAATAATDKEKWDAIVMVAIGDPTGTSTPARTRSPGSSRRRCWPGGARPARAQRSPAGVPEGEKMPWFGPPMSPASMATARYMETWAHALDVYEALGTDPEVTDRIRHVAHLGVRTRNFAFGVHGLSRRPTSPHRADGPVRRGLDLGAGGRRAADHRLGVRLLPTGHPARAPRRHRPGGRGCRRREVADHRTGVRGSSGDGRDAK